MEQNLTPNPSLSFEDVAANIVRKAIRSAVCIDDRFVQPYMTQEEIVSVNDSLPNNEELNSELPRQLYNSFREEGECDLDIYHFKSLEESWHPEYMLNNKDLVVLDWELDGNHGFESTVKILHEIVDSDRIPFVIIYTHKPPETFADIVKILIEEFNPYDADVKSIFYDSLLKSLNNEEIEIDDVVNFWEQRDIVYDLLDCVSNPSKAVVVGESLSQKVSVEFGVTPLVAMRKIKKIVTELSGGEYPDNLERLSYILNSSKFSGYSLESISADKIGLRINNTIVTIFEKSVNDGGVRPENVFSQFSELVCSYPHNFITLLSLEMRDKFRQDFCQIGNEMTSIDEKAFFYHYNKSYGNKNEFYDFLLKTWVNELTEYNLNIAPNIFRTLEQYRIDKKLNDLDGNNLILPLLELAVKLSTINIVGRKDKDRRIRFGDIFKLVHLNSGEKLPDVYLLSITPHCVCVRAGKVENNFYFIKSEKISSDCKRALKGAETGYFSFLNGKNSVFSIDWGECKPFTIHVKKNDISKKNRVVHMERYFEMTYITTLKENFAQRIANKAFGYGTSIGIDLPHL